MRKYFLFSVCTSHLPICWTFPCSAKKETRSPRSLFSTSFLIARSHLQDLSYFSALQGMSSHSFKSLIRWEGFRFVVFKNFPKPLWWYLLWNLSSSEYTVLFGIIGSFHLPLLFTWAETFMAPTSFLFLFGKELNMISDSLKEFH